jgi:hypothetical protein
LLQGKPDFQAICNVEKERHAAIARGDFPPDYINTNSNHNWAIGDNADDPECKLWNEQEYPMEVLTERMSDRVAHAKAQ